MSVHSIVGALIGLGIGYFLTMPFYAFVAFRDSMWTQRAYRLAEQWRRCFSTARSGWGGNCGGGRGSSEAEGADRTRDATVRSR